MRLALLALFMLIILLIPPAGAYSLVKTDVNGELLTAPYVGQKIKLQVTVHVEYESPLPLNGFWLKIWFKKPDGTLTTPKWYDYTNEYIGKGGSKTYYVATDVVVDQAGTWVVYVDLYTKDKTTKLNGASATFAVTEKPSLPPIAGYGVAAALVALAAWYAGRGGG